MSGTAIAFLSGKGGSGKTTLALSIADLLCRCDVRVLLVDCDLSTNGATYFYESQLIDRNQREPSNVYSFDELLDVKDYENTLKPIKIKPNMDFIPSTVGISDQYLTKKISWHERDYAVQLRNFLDWAQSNYDVVLFDCQAGYTELLSALLPLMDVDLFILEADSISASSMRNLHLKIGNYLGRARLYQIFNKATLEEFEIYSKIVGTFFTNIGTLLFDWKIRQAFSRSQTPDIENTSAKYGLDLCEICKIFLYNNLIKEKLEHFSKRLHIQMLDEERKNVSKQLEKLAFNPYKSKRIRIMCIEIILLIMVLVMLYFYSKYGIQYRMNDRYGLDLVTVLPIVVGAVLIALGFIEKYEKHEKHRAFERKLKEIDREIAKLSHLLKDQTSS